jgi:DNA-binding SARP family transcriptional activator
VGSLRISLFGRVQVLHINRPDIMVVKPQVQSLLAFLLLNGHSVHSREKLVDLFWPTSSVGRARDNLNTLLWRLRKVLEPKGTPRGTYLLTTTDEIGFNWDSDFWLDSNVFETCVNEIVAKPVHTLSLNHVEVCEKILILYKGDLLEGFYDEWAISEQERLRLLYINCLDHLMKYYKQQRLFEKSLQYGQKILKYEPTHEAVHREIMRIYLDSSRHALGIQQYQRCRDTLAVELNVVPMTETDALYAQLAGQPSDRPVTLFGQSEIQETLQQVELALRSIYEANLLFVQAKHRFDEAQAQLKQMLRQLENWLS